jgi:magnesium transporter
MKSCKRLATWCLASETPRNCEFTSTSRHAALRRLLCGNLLTLLHSVRAILDANRNALMLLDLKFSIGTLGLAMGTFMAGLYGMNLENFIEETNWGFGAVTGMSVLFSLVVCWFGLGRVRRVQRIKMMSDERPHLPRGGQLYRDEMGHGLLDARNREVLRRAQTQKAMAERKKKFALW